LSAAETSGGASLGRPSIGRRGVVQQENWNNLTGFTFDQGRLFVDAANAATPVTLSTDPDPNAPTEGLVQRHKNIE